MTITYENIRIKGKISFLHIHRLEIKREANTHGVVSIHGITENEVKFNEIEEIISGTELSVVVLREDKTEISPPLFSGLITNVSVRQENDLYSVALEVKTGSVCLDKKPESRSFQDVDMTYSDLVENTLNEKNGQVIFSAGQNDKIVNPIFKYEETAWQFTKRMAGYVGTPIIPDCISSIPQIYFGYPQNGNEITFNYDFYTMKVDKRFHEYIGANKSDYIYYLFKDTNQYSFGDYTMLHGKPYYICGIYAELVDGILEFTYTMGSLPLINNQKVFNNRLSGVSLIGTVTKTYGELVELDLDIDDAPTGSHPYKWTPVTGNTMYLMPEIGTKASLYFQSADDASVLATDSPRTNGSLSKHKPAKTSTIEKKAENISAQQNPRGNQESTEKLTDEQVLKRNISAMIDSLSSGNGEIILSPAHKESAEREHMETNMRSGSAEDSETEYVISQDNFVGGASGGAPMSNPDNKQLRSEGGKELNLTPSQISFISDGLSLLVDDGEGVSANSDKKIKIIAKGKVSFTAPTVSISSPSRIKAVRK